MRKLFRGEPRNHRVVLRASELLFMPRQRTPNCSKCGSAKIIMSNGASRCIPCHRRWGREYYRRSELRRAKSRRSYVLRRYGVEIDDLERMLHEQGGCCAICRRPWPKCVRAKRTHYETMFFQHLCVDHDHRNGKIRGLLCNACNAGIGFFEEDVTRFAEAVRYLRRHGGGLSGHKPTGESLIAFETLRARAADRAKFATQPALFNIEESHPITQGGVGG
jgi:recombination endonuclease VII